MKACEDFLLIVLNALIKVAAEVIEIEKPGMDVGHLAEDIVERFVNIDTEVKQGDDLYLYMTELLTICLIWHSYHDSVKEGDGDRVINMWKFLLVILKKVIERIIAKRL